VGAGNLADLHRTALGRVQRRREREKLAAIRADPTQRGVPVEHAHGLKHAERLIAVRGPGNIETGIMPGEARCIGFCERDQAGDDLRQIGRRREEKNELREFRGHASYRKRMSPESAATIELLQAWAKEDEETAANMPTPPASRAYWSMTYQLPDGSQSLFGAVAYTDTGAIAQVKQQYPGAQVIQLRRIGNVQAIASDEPA
jgi:hypothetical protein